MAGPTQESIAAMDDEELFGASVALRADLAEGDETARPVLALVEAERLDRRAASYAPEYADKAERAREAARILRETGTITGPNQTVKV